MDSSSVVHVQLPRIVHVVNSVEHGGAERVVLDLATAHRGVVGDCEIICLHALGELESEFASRGIPVARIPRPGHGALRTACQLANMLRGRQPHVVHAHNVAPQIAVALGRRLRRWGDSSTRLIYTEHGRLADDRRVILSLRRWLGRDYDAVVAVSEDARDQLLSLRIGRPERTHVVRNGVDLTRFRVDRPRAENPQYRIVSVGRLAEIKGQDVLIEALALVKPRLGQVSVTLVGDGPTRGALEVQSRRLDLADTVHFVGAQQDVRPYLATADLFVLPSRSEGVSLALLEAMASGLPVVTTAVGGTPEVTGPGRGGLLVRPGDPHALCEAMIRLLTDSSLANVESAAARRRVEEAFSFRLTVAAYARLYGLAPGA